MEVRSATHRSAQQILGNCSPANKVTTRSPPISERIVTMPGCSATTSPIMRRRGQADERMTLDQASASCGGTTAISFPSLAT